MGFTKSSVLFIFVLLIVFSVLSSFSVLYKLSLCVVAICLTDLVIQTIPDVFHFRQLLPTFREKAVFVTGCDTGFGNELARRLDKLGVTVFAGCLYPEGPGALELKDMCSTKLQVIHLDITKEELVQAAVKRITASLQNRKLWALVNNAAVIMYGDLELNNIKNVERVLDVNVLGTVRVTQAFLPLIRRARGRVVIVTSIAGRYTMTAMGAYSMSKHALVSLADGLRREMIKFDVSVHTIEPWMYRTKLSSAEHLHGSFMENWELASESVRRDYGEDLPKKMLEHFKFALQYYKPPSATKEVIDDMLDATIGTNPKVKYEEGSLWVIKVLMYLPIQWLDYFTYKNSAC